MPARLRLTAAVIAVIAIAAGAGFTLFGGGSDGDRDDLATVAPSGYFGAIRPPDAPAVDFTLRDQDGKRATMREYRGRSVILTFLYANCEDTCPLAAQQIRGALDQLDGEVPVLAVSVDPANDTPFHMRRFLVQQQMKGRMRFVTGPRAELEKVWATYGIQPQGRGFEHSASTVIVDRDGMQRIGYMTDQLTPDGLAHDLRKLARDS